MAPIRPPNSQTSGAPSSSAFNMSDLAHALPSTSRTPRERTTSRLTLRTTRSAPGGIRRRQPAVPRRSEAEVAALSDMLNAVSLQGSTTTPERLENLQHPVSNNIEALNEAIAWTPEVIANWRTLPDSSGSGNPRGAMVEAQSSTRQEQQPLAQSRPSLVLTRVPTEGRVWAGLINIVNAPTPSIPRPVRGVTYASASAQTEDRARSVGSHGSDDDADMSDAEEVFEAPDRPPRADSMDLE